MHVDWKRLNRHPVVAGLVLATAVFVVIATIVDAIRHDSWGPIWMTAWLPAVLVAGLGRSDAKGCLGRARGRAQH
jgi:asparagine N-glycosylation enzyme membrane subunit Stt3